MADIWLPGFDRVNSSHGRGGTMIADAPPRWTGHTTEGLSRDPHGAAAAHPTPPHCWVCLPSHPFAPRTRIQIVPLNRSAFALKHNPGDPETNRMGAIQVEIEGFSANAAAWSDEDLNWLADEVVKPMCEATGVKVSIYLNTSTVSRLSWSNWAKFNGLLCHRNVPGNTHTDAPINLSYISQRLLSGGGAPVPTPPSGVPDMAVLWQHPDGRWERTWINPATHALETRWQTTAGGNFGPYAPVNTNGLLFEADSLTGSRGLDGNFNWSARKLGGGQANEYIGWYAEPNAGWHGPNDMDG